MVADVNNCLLQVHWLDEESLLLGTAIQLPHA